MSPLVRAVHTQAEYCHVQLRRHDQERQVSAHVPREAQAPVELAIVSVGAVQLILLEALGALREGLYGMKAGRQAGKEVSRTSKR